MRNLITILFIVFWGINLIHGKSIQVHNTQNEIQASKGKLKLKPIRVWNGEDEEDENKFFKTPMDMCIDENGLIYVCDHDLHRIQVFFPSGKFKGTIGKKGRGPGDLLNPTSVAVDLKGNVIVNEGSGMRIQIFNSDWKSIKIIKSELMNRLVAITWNNEIAVASREIFKSGHLISLIDYNGLPKRKIGKYLGGSVSKYTAIGIYLSIDQSNCFYVANQKAPVIRKYSHEGKLLMAATFDLPQHLKVPKVTVKPSGDEIQISTDGLKKPKVKEHSRGIQITDERVQVAFSMATDDKGWTYLVVWGREMTEEEIMNSALIAKFSPGGESTVVRKGIKMDLFNNIDLYRLFVFNQKGKIVGQSKLSSLCNNIYVNNNRVFVIDGYKTQRILEYEIKILGGK